jgi:hypothetical protein
LERKYDIRRKRLGSGEWGMGNVLRGDAWCWLAAFEGFDRSDDDF